MTDQYKDQYQKQYNREIAQVHAPQSLIERTKAAMRAEEMRLAQAAVGERQSRKFSVRSFAYPMTAAAAVLILVSVSMAMRGLKSENMAPAADTAYSGSAENGAVYEAPAADEGYKERPVGMPAAGAVDAGAPMMEAEAAAAEAPAADEAPAVNGEQKAMSAADDMTQSQSTTSGAEESESRRENAEQEKKEAAEDGLTDMAADKDGIIMEKVEKKPAFCDLPDTKTCVYEEKIFLVRKEKAGWVAYTETENGAGYLFRGEMEDQEEFLEAVSQSLEERNSTQEP